MILEKLNNLIRSKYGTLQKEVEQSWERCGEKLEKALTVSTEPDRERFLEEADELFKETIKLLDKSYGTIRDFIEKAEIKR